MRINAINNAYLKHNNISKKPNFTGLFNKKYSYDYDVYMPEKQHKVKNKILGRIDDMLTPEITNNPVGQSKYFMINGIINYKTKLADGFLEVSSDGKVYDDGTCRSRREVILVDREKDKELQELIENAKNDTVNMNERDKVRYLTQILTHKTAKNPQKTTKPGEIILAGNLLGSLHTSGRQNSIMFKVLSDEIGLKTDLVKGMASGAKRIWNVVHYSSGICKIHDINTGIIEDARKSQIYRPMNKS